MGKCLTCKSEDMSSIPRIHTRSSTVTQIGNASVPLTGRWGDVEAERLTESHGPANQRPYINKVECENQLPKDVLFPHVSYAGTCIHTYTFTNNN